MSRRRRRREQWPDEEPTEQVARLEWRIERYLLLRKIADAIKLREEQIAKAYALWREITGKDYEE